MSGGLSSRHLLCRGLQVGTPFRPSGGDFGGNLVNIEDVCILVVKPIYGSKQIVSTSLSQFAFQ